MAKSLRQSSIEPAHPGEILAAITIPATGKSKAEIARLLGVSRQALHDILSERQPITPGMALRIGKLCGNGPDLWLSLQRAYDLDAAERELADVIAKIPTLTAA